MSKLTSFAKSEQMVGRSSNRFMLVPLPVWSAYACEVSSNVCWRR